MKSTLLGLSVLGLSVLALSTALAAQTRIPAGTLIAATLDSSLDERTSVPGQVVTATVAQDVSWGNGLKISAGTQIRGEVVSTTLGGYSEPATVAVRFNQIDVGGSPTLISTDLLAVASPDQIALAQTTTSASDPYSLTTVQVGGDVVGEHAVYAANGQITTDMYFDKSGLEKVGVRVNGGVLSRFTSVPDGPCRPISDNDAPQALWVFSHDACGMYGYGNDITITRAARPSPTGKIALDFGTGDDRSIQRGSGMLLRVTGVR